MQDGLKHLYANNKILSLFNELHLCPKAILSGTLDSINSARKVMESFKKNVHRYMMELFLWGYLENPLVSLPSVQSLNAIRFDTNISSF